MARQGRRLLVNSEPDIFGLLALGALGLLKKDLTRIIREIREFTGKLIIGIFLREARAGIWG